MTRLMTAATAALLVLTCTAEAATVNLSGNRGHGRVTVGNANLYQADDTFVVNVQQNIPGANTGVMVRPGPANAIWRGGRVSGTGINRTAPWKTVYDASNGACMIVENHAGFSVERFRGEYCWDGIRPASGAPNWRIYRSWLFSIRDDSIENDRVQNGKVQESFIEAAHTFYSARPGGGGSAPPHKVEFVGNLMSLGCKLDGGRPCEDRAKELGSAWNSPTGSGQAFKVYSGGRNIDILFRKTS